MKSCSTCQAVKPFSDFRKDRSKRDGYQSRCKLCASLAIRSVYTEKYGLKSKERTKAKALERRLMVADLKRNLGCVVCGEKEPVCLEFHHTDPSVKEFTISNNLSGSLKKLQEEIDKCICVCSNCHKKIHGNIISVDKELFKQGRSVTL